MQIDVGEKNHYTLVLELHLQLHLINIVGKKKQQKLYLLISIVWQWEVNKNIHPHCWEGAPRNILQGQRAQS